MASPTTAEAGLSTEQPSIPSSPKTTAHVELSDPQKAVHAGERPKSIRVPDLFSSILSAKAVLNPHYLAVKDEGDQWIGEYVISTSPDFYYSNDSEARQGSPWGLGG